MAAEETSVYVFGSGDCGQLGLGDEVYSAGRPRRNAFFSDKHVDHVAAGGLHTLALGHAAAGQPVVYAWGCNDEKALGCSPAEFEVGAVSALAWGVPGGVLQPGERVVQLAAGDSISAALTSLGAVYTWGTFRDSKGVLGHPGRAARTPLVPRRLAASQESPAKKAARLDSTRPLSQPMGDERPATPTVTLQETPVRLDALGAVRVVQVAAGANHLLALSSDGALYAWGAGEAGQLGRRVLERHKLGALHPTLVTPRTRGRITRVCAGAYHSLLIAETPAGPALLAMGLNNYGQLGLGDHVDRVVPEAVAPFWPPGVRPVDAAAGEHHSAVLLSDGAVWAFGRGDSGQLGTGALPPGVRCSSVPVRVRLPCAARLLAAGGNHCLAASAAGPDVYAWGYGDMHQLGVGRDVEALFEPERVAASFAGAVVQLSAGGQHSVVLVSSGVSAGRDTAASQPMSDGASQPASEPASHPMSDGLSQTPAGDGAAQPRGAQPRKRGPVLSVSRRTPKRR